MSARAAGARPPRWFAAPLALACAVCGLTGCGHTGSGVPVLPGARVARMVEASLEADHPGLPPGVLRCPDLDFVVGASTRCVRTALLGRGRLVRVLGTVRVVSLRNGGELRADLDSRAAGFGLVGSAVADRVRRRLRGLGVAHPDSVSCPYLDGEVGTAVVCRVVAGTGSVTVRVTTTAVHASTYDLDVAVALLARPATAAPG